MKYAKTSLRVFLGLVFFVFGLNGFLQFIPAPAQAMPEAAMAFSAGLMKAPYFFPLLKATETLGGIALLSGFFVPLFLVILAPITLQIVLFHAFLAPQSMYLQVLMLAVHLILGFQYYKSSYTEMLRAKS